MSFSDWLHNAAVRRCLIVASLSILASVSHAQDDTATPAQQPQQQQAAPAPEPVIEQPIAEPDYYKANCEKPKDHDAADLCEQRRMAKAAEDAVWWARFQTWLGGIGFIAILGTLIFTGIAAFAASRSARIAEQALSVLERPQIFVANVNFDPQITDQNILQFQDQAMPPVGYDAHNQGRTSAIFTEISDQFIFDFKLPDVPDYWEIVKYPELRALAAGGTQHLQCYPVKLRPAVWDKITVEHRMTREVMGHLSAGSILNKHLFFYGYIKYRDLFGAIVTVGHCWKFNFASGQFLPADAKAYNYRKTEHQKTS